MAELAKANGIKVVLSSVWPIYRYPWNPEIAPTEKIIALNAAIKNYAATHGLPYLNYYTAMADQRKGLKTIYSGDGVHPNRMGYRTMGPLSEKAKALAITE